MAWNIPQLSCYRHKLMINIPWCTRHFSSHWSFYYPCIYVKFFWSFNCVSLFSFSAGISGLVLWCLLTRLSCPLKPWGRWLPVRILVLLEFSSCKKKAFFSTITSFMLQTWDCIEKKIRWDLLVLLARIAFYKWTLYELDYNWIEFDWIYEVLCGDNELASNKFYGI